MAEQKNDNVNDGAIGEFVKVFDEGKLRAKSCDIQEPYNKLSKQEQNELIIIRRIDLTIMFALY